MQIVTRAMTEPIFPCAGLLVAKTLTNATANPFLSGGAGSYNPVLALDVFQVQVGSLLWQILSIWALWGCSSE